MPFEEFINTIRFVCWALQFPGQFVVSFAWMVNFSSELGVVHSHANVGQKVTPVNNGRTAVLYHFSTYDELEEMRQPAMRFKLGLTTEK